jgi:hypothetical protein
MYCRVDVIHVVVVVVPIDLTVILPFYDWLRRDSETFIPSFIDC